MVQVHSGAGVHPRRGSLVGVLYRQESKSRGVFYFINLPVPPRPDIRDDDPSDSAPPVNSGPPPPTSLGPSTVT